MKPKVLDINENVKWIGILDFDIKTFDIVMETEHGTTYNSYFINAEKKTIVETAKEKFSDEYLEKIKSVTNPEEIEYIVLDHTEPDHAGSLKKLLEIAVNATVVGSGQAIKYVQDMHEIDFKYQIVKDGDELDLGNKTLKLSVLQIYIGQILYIHIWLKIKFYLLAILLEHTIAQMKCSTI